MRTGAQIGIELPFLWYAIPIKKSAQSRSHRPITAVEFDKMLGSVNGHTGFLVARDTAILMTLYHTGMRLSELTALNMSSFDPDDQSFITITRKRRDKKNKRKVYIPRDAVIVIQTYMDIRQYYSGHDALFINMNTGKRLVGRTVQNIVKQFAIDAKLDPTLFKPHAFRHGWGMRAAEAQMYPPHIQAQLGHTNLSGSQGYFNVTNMALKKEILKKMDKHTRGAVDRAVALLNRFGIFRYHGTEKKPRTT